MVLTAHSQQSAQVLSKSVSNKQHFTREVKRILCPYLASLSSVVAEPSQVALCTPSPVRDSLVEKGSASKGTLVLRPKQFFCPSLASHCSVETYTSFLAFCEHAQISVQVLSESVNNKGHFTRETETVFCPYLASHSSVFTGTSKVALRTRPPQSVRVWSISVSALYSRGQNSFSFLSRPALQRGDGCILPGTLCACAAISSSLVDIG
jgi:hypothetical protein